MVSRGFRGRPYDVFGNLEIGATTSGYAFTGREWDSETGLSYYRARYYDPIVGRFISEDPIRFAGGVSFYRYVENDPISQTDPYGLEAGAEYRWQWCVGSGQCVSPPPPPDPTGWPDQDARDAQRRNFSHPDPHLGGFRHCMAACLLKRRFGFAGEVMVNWYDLLFEPAFRNGHDDPDDLNSISDMGAEQHGLSCASGPRTCELECLEIYRTPAMGGRP